MRFIFTVHNHQPVGNFPNVFEEAYQKSYLPFLDVFEGYTPLKLTLHTSGPLMEWLTEEHPEYVDRIASLVRKHRIEIIGGPFFEPILAMLPSRDRLGQIAMYSEYLKKHLGGDAAGLWIPERVWEQSYVSDLADAGMHYTILDDVHIKSVLGEETDTAGYYLTEDNGRTLNIFAGDDELRHLIPFKKIETVIGYFRYRSRTGGDYPVLVHADDGEKFGCWPETYKSTYNERWLHGFFEALCENSDWLQTVTPSEVLSSTPPLGKIYIPDASYREMMEWSSLKNGEAEYPRGFWRNFKVKYPESDEMYCRMMAVSARLHKAELEGFTGADIENARETLYRSQCNCGYWHGTFGGVYLPHLRNAVYHHLIACDNLIDEAVERPMPWVESQTADFNFDSHNEVRLTNEYLNVLVAPQRGGIMYELDIKAIAHNLLATLNRRSETYHQKLLHRNVSDTAEAERKIICKQEGLERRMLIDPYPRKNLVDMFYDYDTDIESVRNLSVKQHGDFVHSEYDAVIRKKTGRIQILLSREGFAYGTKIRIDKAVTMSEGSNTLEIAYRLSQLPKGYKIHFAVEFNFAGMPGNADNRYFSSGSAARLGNLSSQLDLTQETRLSLYDDWLGLDAALTVNRPADFYAFPIETVSQSVEGFEAVHQSVVVQPHWKFVADASGIFETEMRLQLDTSAASRRDFEAKELLKDAAKLLVEELV